MQDPVTQPSTRLGLVLRDWRRRRALTQMDLALAADTSARHVSFVETGRAKPSPAMLVALVRALALPHHEASLILQLGARQPPATGELDGGADALALILESQEPFAALAFDRLWNVVMVNRCYGRFINRQFPAQTVPVLEPMGVGALNLLRLVMSPRWLRPLIVNWTEVAAAILTRARQAVFSSDDEAAAGALLHEVLGYPGVRALWDAIDPGAPPPLIVPSLIRLGDRVFRTQSTILTLGSSAHEASAGLRIEIFHRVT